MLTFGRNLRVRRPAAEASFAGDSVMAMALVVLIASQAAVPCVAQQKMLREGSRGIFLPSDRLDARGIQRAKQLIASGEYSQAIRFLDDVLARDEDAFVAGPSVQRSEPPSSTETGVKRPASESPRRSPEGQPAGGGVPPPKTDASKRVAATKTHSTSREYAGLKETARQMLRDLPLEGRRIYESTFGPVARRMLEQSISSGDLQQLRQITHRFFYTPAGHEAALLFAHYEADKGRHLTAALTYQQLLESREAAARFQPQLSVLAAMSWLAAGHSSRSAEILEELAAEGYRDFELSGQQYRVKNSPGDPVEWFVQAVGTPVVDNALTERQWLTPRGNPARNGQTAGGLPHLRVRWQVRLLEHHSLEAIYEEMAGLLTLQKKSRLPAAAPLAVGDYVITRSAHGLIAIDFNTGKRIWQAQPQRETMLQELMDGTHQHNPSAREVEPAQAFARMVWEDFLYNTSSSDGQRVYVIRDLGQPNLDRLESPLFMRRRSVRASENDTNRLCAYDLPTQGKLVWEIDGAARSDELQGAFFLGAPVTVGQSVYCLAEIKSETAIYLVSLDRQTGDLQWRQQLADLEIGIAFDSRRRLQAVIPSYDEGMLVCPTGAGVVVGVDLAKQALAWAYSYQAEGSPTRRSRVLEAQAHLADQRWVHSAPVIADGRILLTPPESNMLHCLDLVSGKLLWKQPRGDSLFLAGVDGGRVLLVGNRQMSALRLADGKPAWPSGHLALPIGGTPTGSGFFSAGEYFLPLSNAEVIAVDVARGKVVDTATSRDGQPLGNLICYRGAVLSQTGRFLDCYEQVEVLRTESERRLTENATDFEALRTLGEIAYNDGQLPKAIALLSKAYRSAEDDLRTREVLSEALVAALDEDFASYQDQLPLLAEIQQGTAATRLTLLRLQSQGLLGLGQASAAFEACLQAYDLLANMSPTAARDAELLIGRDHQVSAQSWLAAQTAAAWAAASPLERKQIAEQFSPLLTQASQAADLSAWQQFYNCFAALELTDRLGIDLAAAYIGEGNLLAAQQLLLSLKESADLSVSNAAIAYSSQILHDRELAEGRLAHLAKPYDEVLRGRLADQECLPGKSGLQCLAAWAESASPPVWPYGRVDLSLEELTLSRRKRGNRSPQTGIQLERSDEVLAGCEVTLVGVSSGRNREVTIRDSLGRTFFQANLDQGARGSMNSRGNVYGVSRGNLLILSLGRQLVAYDTLSPSRGALWRKETTSSLQYLRQRSVPQGLRLGGARSLRSQSGGDLIGVIGPVHSGCVVYQFEQSLLCVDALSGAIRWSRKNLPIGCELYGDEQHVYVVPKEATEALVFGLIDGRELGETTAALPLWQERLATVGRQIICWRRLDGGDRAGWRWELAAIDSLSGDIEWHYDFEKKAQIDIFQSRFAAVVESTGSCVVVDLRDGRRLVDQTIEPNRSFQEVHLLVGADSFVVAVQESHQADPTRRVSGFNRVDFTKPFAGQIYRFDRMTGKAVWSRPAEVEGLPLLLTQPSDLPVIVFAGNILQRDKQGSKNEIGVMLLEKSTGRLLFRQEDLPASPNRFYVRAGDVASKEVVVDMLTRTITLAFTDQPRAPEPPAMHEAERGNKSASKGLQKIYEMIMRGG